MTLSQDLMKFMIFLIVVHKILWSFWMVTPESDMTRYNSYMCYCTFFFLSMLHLTRAQGDLVEMWRYILGDYALFERIDEWYLKAMNEIDFYWFSPGVFISSNFNYERPKWP